jgi:flavin-dependent dehydrogenase
VSSTSASSPYDVIVIGAGPAGCAAARLLAAWGHRVLVVHRLRGPAHRLAESIPPSAQRVLATLGALSAVEDGGFLSWQGNLVWWGDAVHDARIESFPPGVAGYQVRRDAFDALLRRLARASGAGFVSTAVVDVKPSANAAPDIDGQWTDVVTESDGQPVTRLARFVLDCSGRAGVLARRGYRRAATTRTIALSAAWSWARQEPGRGPAASQTAVASYADGWAWSIATGADSREVTVMVDPARTDLQRRGTARDTYLAEISKITAFRAWLEGATMIAGPWGADASTYDASSYAGPGFLLVGDAASAIDPLSSFGVKKALVSGWLAAVAVHTALTAPEMAGEAWGFFDRREREMVAAAERQAATLARTAQGAGEPPFWLARAVATDSDSGDVDVVALAADQSVLAAFAELRRLGSVRLSPGPRLRIEPRAAVRDRRIVLDDHLVLPEWPHGLRYLRNVDLLLLTRLAPSHGDVGMLCEAMERAQPGVQLPDVLGALSVLIARGVLGVKGS